MSPSVVAGVLPAVAPALPPEHQRFQALCGRRGWTPKAASEAFGVSQALVQAWTTRPDSGRFRPMRRPYLLILDTLEQQAIGA